MLRQFSDKLIPWASRIKGTVETKHIGKARLAITEEYTETGRERAYRAMRRDIGVKPWKLLTFHWSFSSDVRNPYAGTNGIAYGGKGVTFRWLYAYLALRYGDFIGKFFAVDVYDCCSYELTDFVRECRKGNYEDALVRLQYALKRELKDYLAYSGAGTASDKTIKRRLASGIYETGRFYATRQLADDIYITVSLPKGALYGRS